MFNKIKGYGILRKIWERVYDYPGFLEFTQILNPIQRRYDAKTESRNPIPDNMSYFNNRINCWRNIKLFYSFLSLPKL